MIGYKIAKNGEKPVVITLEIPSDALTNMNRSSIAVKDTASYRANKAKVLKIEDEEGNCYTTAVSFCYTKKSLEYNVGENIEEPTYNTDPEKVHAEGIHYFLNRRVAEKYCFPNTMKNRLYESWWENGQKLEEYPIVDGKMHGIDQIWYDNGLKSEVTAYVDGVKHGLTQEWYENGQKHKEFSYVKGVRHGLYRMWRSDGAKLEEFIYENGKPAIGHRWHSAKDCLLSAEHHAQGRCL